MRGKEGGIVTELEGKVKGKNSREKNYFLLLP